MRLVLENIGMLSKADLQVNGISLIAGSNDSGKSTISKIFYSVVKGLNLNKKYFENWKNGIIKDNYQEILKVLRANDVDINGLITDEINKDWVDRLRTLTEKVIKTTHQKEAFLKYIRHIDYYIRLDFDSKSAREEELYQYLTLEFSRQVSSVFKEKHAKVKIYDIEGKSEFTINEYYTLVNKKIIELSKNIDLYYNDAYYIESPLIINGSLEKSTVFSDSNEMLTRDRKDYLKNVLSNQNIIASDELISNKVKSVYAKIGKIINGEIILDPIDGISYSKNNQDIHIDNVAVGIKSFGVLQLLLKKNRLNSRTLLIIDEPEIHLHPNWQLKYAEILVILSQELNVPILLTSHSPYFIEALDIYSKKYGYSKSVNYYYTKKTKNGLSSKLIDATDDITPLLMTLSDAYYTIKEIEDELNN